MSKIWSKKGGAKKSAVAAIVEEYTAGNDVLLDHDLIPFDLQASMAHAKGLVKAKVLSNAESAKLVRELTALKKQWQAGKFTVELADEDCHTAIENALVKKLGALGKKIHAGRSRNDQVITAIRLYEREQLDETISHSIALAEKFLSFAKMHEFVPMPGYTHTQPAMPSSVGMWAGSFAEMLILNIHTLKNARVLVNRSPLGSSAAFGSSIKLDRAYTSKLMGFDKPLIVSLTSQNTRGKIEADVVSALASLSATLQQFAGDLILFGGNTFGYFDIDEALTTGSSIMPQKKNLDPAELMRADYSKLVGLEFSLRDLTKNLSSGYHRDLQLSKELVMEAFDRSHATLQIASLFIENIKPNITKLEAAFTGEFFAADMANDLVAGGLPFRDAYQEVKEKISDIEVPDLKKNLLSKKHLGATGNLGLSHLKSELSSIKKK